MEAEYMLVEFLMGIMDWMRKFWLVVLFLVFVIAVIVVLHFQLKGDEDACRDKGGTPVEKRNGGVVCVEKMVP